MRRLGQLVAVLAVLLVSVGLVDAGGTPAGKCAAAKSKAASKKLASKLKCYAKAFGAGKPVDSVCLTAADTKFSTAVGKADTKGGCLFTGDANTLEAVVDNAVKVINAFDPNSTPGCCTFIGSGDCGYYDAATCAGLFGTSGAAGTVCDGATGNCIPPPAAPGKCCSGAPGYPCLAGPGPGGYTTDETSCNGGGGKFDPNESSLCPPDGSGRCVSF
jgi:hypothetical protein